MQQTDQWWRVHLTTGVYWPGYSPWHSENEESRSDVYEKTFWTTNLHIYIGRNCSHVKTFFQVQALNCQDIMQFWEYNNLGDIHRFSLSRAHRHNSQYSSWFIMSSWMSSLKSESTFGSTNCIWVKYSDHSSALISALVCLPFIDFRAFQHSRTSWREW